MDVNVQEIKQWVKKHRFWVINACIGVALLGIYLYLISFGVRGKYRNQVLRREQVLRNIRDVTRDDPVSEGELKRIQKKNKTIRRQLRAIINQIFLPMGQDLEKWIGGESDPDPRPFRDKYLDRLGQLRNQVKEAGVRLGEKTDDDNPLGGFNGGGNEEADVFVERTVEEGNLEKVQKEYWIQKRIAQDAIDTGVKWISSVNFLGEKESIYLTPDQILADRIAVELKVGLSIEQVTTFLRNLLDWDRKTSSQYQKIPLELRRFEVSKDGSTMEEEVKDSVLASKLKDWNPPYSKYENKPPEVTLLVRFDVLDIREKKLQSLLDKLKKGDET